MELIEQGAGSLVDGVADAFRALAVDGEDALGRLGALYDAAVTFEDPLQRVEGLEAFLALNERLLGRMRRIWVDVTSQVGTEHEFVLVWRMKLVPRLGPSLEVHGTSHMQAVAGKVVRQRDYWDLGELMASGVPGGRRVLRALLRLFA